MNLEALREEIDAIDDTLVQAFAKRMDVVARVSQAKKEQGLPTLDPAREREKLADIASKLPPELEQYGYALWSMLFEISRGYQNAMNPQPSALRQEIQAAIENTPNLFPPSATVACQGVEGAYSQLACDNKNQQRVQGKFQQRADKFRHSDLHPRPLEGMAGHL